MGLSLQAMWCYQNNVPLIESSQYSGGLIIGLALQYDAVYIDSPRVGLLAITMTRESSGALIGSCARTLPKMTINLRSVQTVIFLTAAFTHRKSGYDTTTYPGCEYDNHTLERCTYSISKSDKGRNVVLGLIEEYYREPLRQLHNPKNYRRLGFHE